LILLLSLTLFTYCTCYWSSGYCTRVFLFLLYLFFSFWIQTRSKKAFFYVSGVSATENQYWENILISFFCTFIITNCSPMTLSRMILPFIVYFIQSDITLL